MCSVPKFMPLSDYIQVTTPRLSNESPPQNLSKVSKPPRLDAELIPAVAADDNALSVCLSVCLCILKGVSNFVESSLEFGVTSFNAEP